MEPGIKTTNLDFLRVYLITDRSLLPGGDFLHAIESALAGGVRSIQLREKGLSQEQLLPLAKDMIRLTQNYGAKLFINSHADLADAIGADGVQLTEASPPVKDIRKKFPKLLIGVSTHSLESARSKQNDGADFITFSPIFDTPSKQLYGPPQGLDRLKKVASSIDIPVIALGGIKLNNALSVLRRGAFGIALISGIWKSSSITNTSHQFMKLGEMI